MARIRTCACGSGQQSEWYYDARGIELCRACDACWPKISKTFRPDILTNPNYEADEAIEPE